MDRIESWVLVWALTVILNVVPAFMPPTWALLVYFRVADGLDVLPLTLTGALGATTGRALLALASRSLGDRLAPPRWRENITALATTLESRPAFSLPTLGLFALGPVPSNHLFIAAGLAHAPLAPILAVFAVARFISYLIWVNVASTAARSIEEAIGPRLGSGVAIAIQVAGFLLLMLVMQIDWTQRLRDWKIAVPSSTESTRPRSEPPEKP
jgi:membrane protein YqaA with SNARE-associated domain